MRQKEHLVIQQLERKQLHQHCEVLAVLVEPLEEEDVALLFTADGEQQSAELVQEVQQGPDR